MNIPTWPAGKPSTDDSFDNCVEGFITTMLVVGAAIGVCLGVVLCFGGIALCYGIGHICGWW